MYSEKHVTEVKIERIIHLGKSFTINQKVLSSYVQRINQITYSIKSYNNTIKMASTTANATTTTTIKSTPKSLPKFYKGLLYSTLSFINEYIEDEEQRKTLYSKLPLFEDVEKQIEYFNTNCDLKKVHNEVYKPLLKQHKKEIKEANKPVKEKKPRAPRKKKAEKEAKEEAPTETEPSSSSTVEGSDVAVADSKEKKTTKKSTKDKTDSSDPPKLKKPRAPRKKKDTSTTDSTVDNGENKTPTPVRKASDSTVSATNEEELTYDKMEK